MVSGQGIAAGAVVTSVQGLVCGRSGYHRRTRVTRWMVSDSELACLSAGSMLSWQLSQ